MADFKRMKLAVQYANILRSVLGNNLVSVFLFGSVVKQEVKSCDVTPNRNRAAGYSY